MCAGSMNECDIPKPSEFVPNNQHNFTWKKKQRGDIFTIVIATAEISEIYGISTK